MKETMKRKPLLSLVCAIVFPVAALAVTDDDVSQKPNVIYVENATVAPGADATIAVRLKTNTTTVTAFQFDLYLPTGVTVDGDVSTAIRKSEMETSSHQIYAAWMKSGACRVICYSSSNTKLKSKEGEVAVIDIKVDGNVQPGTYPVILRNVEIARVDGRASTKLTKIQTSINIENNAPTDILQAGDGQSDGNDATYHLLGQKVKKVRRGQIGIRRGKKTIEK